MRNQPIAAMLLLAALTACSGGGDTEPVKTATVTATKTPTLSAEEARAACVDAWADSIGARPDDFDPETDSDPEPAECAGLPEGEWMDRYMEGLSISNQRGLEERQRELDEASEAATTG